MNTKSLRAKCCFKVKEFQDLRSRNATPEKITRILAMILGKVHKPYETPYHFDRIEMILGPFWQQRNIRRAPKPKRPRVNRYTSAKLSRALVLTKLSAGQIVEVCR